MDRYQSGVVNGVHSGIKSSQSSGVHQGSVLDPVIFNLFVSIMINGSVCKVYPMGGAILLFWGTVQAHMLYRVTHDGHRILKPYQEASY